MKLKSALYTGILHHRRTKPKIHDFSYPVLLFYIDLQEIHSIFKVPFFFSFHSPRLLGFERKDYLKGEESLEGAVRKIIFTKTGKHSKGPIRLLTQIRYFGFCFNPVSFYYCFDEEDHHLEFIVTEITNTPWNERKAYVFETESHLKEFEFEFKKDFHVSPFFPMDLEYRWKFNQPFPLIPESTLWVNMEDWESLDQEKFGTKIFNAHLKLKPKPMTGLNLMLSILSFPLLTFKAFGAIYYQAFKIYFKKIPFLSHPKFKLGEGQ